MLLDIRRDCNAFMGDQRGYPLGGPGAFIGRIDVPKRLEGQLAAAFRRKAERMVRAAHGEHGSTRRPSLVEDVELRARVAAKLERDQRKQYRFTGARGADDKHVADIADMGGQRSEEHTSELQSLMRISYAVFCLKKKN